MFEKNNLIDITADIMKILWLIVSGWCVGTWNAIKVSFYLLLMWGLPLTLIFGDHPLIIQIVGFILFMVLPFAFIDKDIFDD